MSWPALTTVLEFLMDPNRRLLFARALGASLWSLATGYCAGWVAGCAFAALAHLVPTLRTGADRVAMGSARHPVKSHSHRCSLRWQVATRRRPRSLH
jgi:ABC-type nitrate/sulfonate/bicarbonate transport system permease component